MAYNKIKNPKSGKMVSINSKLGKEILTKYITYLNGGGFNVINKPTFRMFGVHWCGHCTRTKPIFDSVKVDGLETKYIDCEEGANQELVNKFKDKIEGYPTFILSKKNKESITFPREKERTRENIEAWLSSEIAGPGIEVESPIHESPPLNPTPGPLMKFFNFKTTHHNDEPTQPLNKKRTNRKRRKSPKKKGSPNKRAVTKKKGSPNKRKAPKKKRSPRKHKAPKKN